MYEKLSKRDKTVNYRIGTKAEHCGNCSMYAARRCDIVVGDIDPKGYCDRWEAKHDQKAEAA